MSSTNKCRRLRDTAVAAATVLLVPASPAQTAPEPVIVITGNPLGSERALQPAAVLSGHGLALRRSATLGETLDGLPGLAATGFGPNASRPVIRGLDGDRVRMLENGGASVDASSLSFDHAVAIDPLVVERLEVLRGPAVLLYGGSATGGVVNAIDNRIPRAAAAAMLAARAEARAGGAANERSGAAVVEGFLPGGAGAAGGADRGLAWHADAFGRRTDDLRTPAYTPVEGGTPLEPTTRVRNSASRGEGGAVGASFVGSAGYAGASADTYRNRYGVTAEPDVTIRMQRERRAFAAAWKPGEAGVAGIEQVAIDAAHTNYRHEEIEGSGEVGTVFSSRADDARIELRHAPLFGLRGVLGAQWEQRDFSALGEEAFVPGTTTRQLALFVYEEFTLAAGVVLSGGLRGERVRVASEGDAADAAEVRFGPAAERRFSPRSAALGARAALPAGWTFTAGLASSQRAPTTYELFANGVHVATGAFEVGDPALGVERSRHAELGLAWKNGAHHVELQWFTTRFSNYIALDATGNVVVVPASEPGVPDETFPEVAFRAVRARLTGFELDGRTRLLAGAPFDPRFELSFAWTLDRVRGDNLDRHEPLPRLAPLRARLALEAARGVWRGGLAVRHAARQNRVPATDTPTAGYTMLDLWAGVALPLPGDASAIVRVSNATDRLGYNAATIVTLRGLAPLPGRAPSATLRWRW